MKKYLSFSDDELVSMYAQGDNEAFETLLDRHQQKVYSYIFFLVKNRDVSDDIFQDTFFKVVTVIRQGKYSANDKFASWVTRIAHNMIIDYFRKDQMESLCTDEQCEYDYFIQKDLLDDNLEDKLVYEQIMKDVARLVNKLPEEQREVIRMRFYDDLSFKEIAEKTDVSINTALGRMRYALINMRRIADENKIALEVR